MNEFITTLCNVFRVKIQIYFFIFFWIFHTTNVAHSSLFNFFPIFIGIYHELSEYPYCLMAQATQMDIVWCLACGKFTQTA